MALDNTQRTVLAALHRKFIDGCHILHHNGVLDAYGHLSVRHPFDPQVFIMSKYFAPGTISSPDDLIEYHVSNAEPLDPSSTKGYAERHIHSEVYKRHADVQAVIHSHAESVIPYTITGVPLRPCYHMAGFLGLGEKGHPAVYDAADFFREDDIPDMLVRNPHLGEALAATFDSGNVVTLMRGHGLTLIGPSIEEVISRAIYTMKNASIQTAAVTLHGAFVAQGGQGVQGGGLKYLDENESKAATNMLKWSAQRPWKLWVREVEASGLYLNSA
ncbi:hypothetical protein VPNG_07315 [Cytospora leucostoma]|uniref:Class II aldolase/adducin N-terminal domain-containing protein n=1 Tax=Cytospora leucostoma TaxID=1230097 RepID=A0A423WV59_9PEZI|nr:hypothetical protein VPNG_07315 [Cytospora leucostoma]